MNIKFKILWYEDEPDWLAGAREDVENILKKHSLLPELDIRDGQAFDRTAVIGNDYDLILMDYRLEDGVTGDEIISVIRENSNLTDILFYSSDLDGMYNSLKNGIPLLDGIYLAKRKNELFAEKVEQLISKIIKRSEDIVNLRGFVLDNTSDFETRVEKILEMAMMKIDEAKREELQERIKRRLEHDVNDINDKLKEITTAGDSFAAANRDHRIMNMAGRMEVLQALLKILTTDYGMVEVCSRPIAEYYYVKVGAYRNQLGHADATTKSIIVRGEEIEINQDLHRMLRRNIVEMDNILQIIQRFIESM